MSETNQKPALYASEYIMESMVGTSTIINGREYLYFAGTGYFQLQSHPEMIKACVDATLKFGIGSATSRSINGTSNILVKLEVQIAAFFDTEDSAYLPSGYLSNLAGFQALEKMGLCDLLFIDEGSHYSNIDAAYVLQKKVIPFKHCNPADLKAKLNKYLKNGEKALIASDGLFPIWAEIAPLSDYLQLAEEFDASVWIDDSHSVGILGETGKGLTEHLHMSNKRIYKGATLSKAFGAYGGIVFGDSDFISTVKNGNVMKGSSSPPHAMVASAAKGLEIVKAHPELRRLLRENASYLKNGLKKLGLELEQNHFPIATFTLGDSDRMKMIHQALMEKGIYIQFVNYVGSGPGGVLRIVLTSSHTKEQMDALLSALKDVI